VSTPLPWAIRVSRTESGEALDRLMDLWCEAMTAAGNIARSIGFDTYMGQRDWEAAKGSIIRAYGRSNPDHQSALDTLSAAIHQRNVLGFQLRLDGRPARAIE
jgi:hypothetical protein